MHRLRMQLQDDFARNLKTDAGTYIARKPMQGIPMHGKELMHGLSNAGKNQCTPFSPNARLFIARINNARKKTLQEPIKARIRAQNRIKLHFLRQNQTKNAKCIKIMSI